MSCLFWMVLKCTNFPEGGYKLVQLLFWNTSLKFCLFCISALLSTTKHHRSTGSWAKQRLPAAGLDIPVLKVSGNVSAPGKSKAMDKFRAGWELRALYCTKQSINQNVRTGGLLFCTDVCSMGLDVPELVIGVSLGTSDTQFTVHVSFESRNF